MGFQDFSELAVVTAMYFPLSNQYDYCDKYISYVFGVLKEKKTENASVNGNIKRVKIQNVSWTKMENYNIFNK